MVFGILVLVFCIIGATFAYFTAIAASNNISGNMASVNIDLNIEKITHVDEEKGGLIPMSNNMVEVGINNNCIDNNGNAVCQIYKITTTNTGSTNLFLDGYITLTGGSGEPADYNYKNNKTTMRWAQVFCDENINCITVGNTTTGATGIDAFTTLDNQTDKTGLNQDNIKSNYNDVIGNGTIQDSSYDVINKNYIRVSDHDTSSTNYDRKKDVTSALVYNQQLNTTNPSSEYYFVVWLSENGHNQTQIITDKFFGGLVTFTTSSGNITGTFGNYTGVNSGATEKVLMTDYIKDLYNDGSSIDMVELGDESDEERPKAYLNSTQGLMLDNNGEYRYYGAAPNNYVKFNNELWRIISVSNVKFSVDDTVGEERVKLIRNESIGEYSYDNDYNGHPFEDAFVTTLLNDYYYNGKDNQTCYIYNSTNYGSEPVMCNFSNIGLSDGAKNQIGDTLWHSYDYFQFGYTGSFPNRFYTELINNGTVIKMPISLMDPSDYGYATDLSKCFNELSGYDDINCKSNDWLYSGTNAQWLMNSSFHVDWGIYFPFTILDSGAVDFAYSPNIYNIRPSVYLKHNISITGGTGSSNDPYTLSEG